MLGAVCGYLALWAITWMYGPAALHRQLYIEAYPDWQRSESRYKKAVQEHQWVLPHLPVYDHGPYIKVEKVFCPAPLFFRAECVQAVGGLEGHNWTAWYLVTPWHLYGFAIIHGWVS